ncbi:hypothetical protein CASFOL_026262 [Castilleja foliolosa]|uniref:Uncharacterized protein n=1 Tax=Castilleja foliolosa TaxID=1961234 RepID=A0ABD3CMH8_9LAMI
MSVSFSIAVPCTITSHRPSYQMAMPSVRFLRVPIPAKTSLLRLCFANSSNTSMPESSDLDTSSVEKQGTFSQTGKNGIFQGISLNEILIKLKRYGVSGILSYGLLNTAYYITTFLVVWLYVAPAPGRMGYVAAVERFLKVMAMVWAGSQVTKLIRAAGALVLAPFVDRGLSWITAKFEFKSQGKASMTIAGFCFGLAFIMFVVVTLLWA